MPSQSLPARRTTEEDRAASIRHAQAAIVQRQDDALALTFAGFSIGMDRHDRAAAFAAFEAELAVSPSTALTYILGAVILGWTGEAERAIEWGERAIRLSPFDPWAFAALHSLTHGHFQRGRYQEAANAALRGRFESHFGFWCERSNRPKICG